ncbi:RNA-directed DNA polymerase, eukaryota [Tanacetum coccineum]
MESLLSENSKTDNSDNHDHDIDDNGFHDIEEGEIRNMNVNQEEEVVKDTQWSVGVEQIDKDQVDSPINNTESHKQPTKETREIQKEDSESISKPSGFEGSKNDLKKFIDSLGAKQGIQETHSLKIDSFKAKSLWGNFQFDYAVCPSSGRSGCLVSIWDPNVFIIFPSENLLIVEGIWTSSHLQCFMINVYAPQEDRKKETLWHNILDFKDRNPGHYFIFGDFNVVRYTSKRIGTAFNPNSANAFNQFIRDGHLWDIPLGGHLFTRINNRGDKLSKLDRFLITENSASLMHNYSAQVLDCHISYHRPLILSPSSLDFGPIPFKFYNSWLLDKNLHDIVAKFWEHHVFENGSNLIVSFKNKMKALKPIIKEWSKNRSSSQSRDKEDLIRKIKDFDDNIASGTGDVMVGSQQKEKQKKKASGSSTFKRRYLSIHGIKHEGQWISEPHRIKAVFYSFFVTKFQRKNVVKIVNRSPFYKSLHDDKNSFLVSTVNETEIRDAIWDCGSKKSSGPDGFTFAFYKKFWDMLKEEAVGFVQDFFNTGDPLSPFLFIIAMEGLHVAIEDAMVAGLYRGLKVNTLILSHLSFADDALFIDCNMANVRSWEPIFKKFSKRLSKWKSLLLSIRGRSTLISSVLGSIGTYYLSLFPMPITVNKKLESIRSNFFWGSDTSSKKISWISWNLVLASRGNGGLGVWEEMSGPINTMHEKGFIPRSFLQKCVNNGASTKFWYETWLGNSPLQHQYPRLFRLALNKECLLRECWNNDWCLNWTRPISSGKPSFTVKTTREHIDQCYLLNDGLLTRWNRFLPRKINIFIWRALRDRLPTRWNLSRKGIDVDSLNYPTCDFGIETINHSMWFCSLATVVWHRVFVWLDISSPSTSNLQDIYIWLDDLHISSARKTVLETICGGVLWSLWNFRNELIFGTSPPKRCNLIDKIVDYSYRWYSTRNKLPSITWNNNWLRNPLEVSTL